MRVARDLAVAAGRFAYGFVFGDDWSVAAVMLGALIATALLAAAHVNAWWLVPVLAVAMTAVSLWRRRQAVRQS